MKMPFGVHKGKELNEMPLKYLYWLKDTVEVGNGLREAIDKAIQKCLIDQIMAWQQEYRRDEIEAMSYSERQLIWVRFAPSSLGEDRGKA